jgi:hypothetical protein
MYGLKYIINGSGTFYIISEKVKRGMEEEASNKKERM